MDRRRARQRIAAALTLSVAAASMSAGACARGHRSDVHAIGRPPASDRNAASSTPDPDEDEPAPRAHLTAAPATTSMTTLGDGFPDAGPWVSFYGSAAQMGDLARVARRFRIINIDADPGAGNFSDAQLTQLRAAGRNRVISYMNLGACESYRNYWSTAPAGLLPCSANRTAQRGSYDGYPDETWMDPSNEAYQRLILEHVAPRLAARTDGFYLDNLEILEHPSVTSNGPCSATCRQGGLDLVRKLREKFPRHLLVMQNATSDVTRLGVTGGIAFPRLLDGVAHEDVHAPKYDATADEQLVAWSAMGLTSRTGRRFWIATEDYVGSCRNAHAARAAMARSRARGFSPYVSDESSGQKVVCFWD